MRIPAALASALLLTSCARLAQSPIPSAPLDNGESAVRPQAAWTCTQTPSLQTRGRAEEPQAGSGYSALYKFKAQPDGALPYDGLVAVNGKLYGTTQQGGASGYGAVFEFDTAGAERVIYSFKDGSDGAYPCAGLTNVNGALYGTTSAGGTASGWGTIFAVTTSGKERVVYRFQAGKDGAAPYASLLFFKGKLYGTTVEGGTPGWGTAFVTTTSGPAHVLYTFKAGKDGGYPYGKLLAVNGKLYGTTMQGGASGWGTIFDLTTAGAEHVLYSFKAGKDGGYPFGELVNVSGKLYGTTKYGGSAGYGTVFDSRFRVTNTCSIRLRAAATARIPTPVCSPYKGTLYGTTYEGGSPNWGTVFAVTTLGKERVLHAFQAQNHGATDGANPFARVTDSTASSTAPRRAAVQNRMGNDLQRNAVALDLASRCRR